MRRRHFLTLLGGAALTAPQLAQAQQPGRVHRVGYMGLGAQSADANRYDAFRGELARLGYIEGKNLAIEGCWLGSAGYGELPKLAGELVDAKVDVIVTATTNGVAATKRATQTIPIVFAAVGDAVAMGLVASLSRPGGNVTGTSYFLPELAAKRLELLKEAIPNLAHAGLLINPTNRSAVAVAEAVRASAQSLRVEFSEFAAKDPAEFENAFGAMATKSATAVVISEDPMLIFNSGAIAKLAVQHKIATCGFRESAQAGGFAGYGIDFIDLWRRAATFVDKILKGSKPEDIPVEQATKFITTINLTTAKAIGLDVQPTLLARADETIE
jgi:putative ABC transport system substrate-binding protein